MRERRELNQLILICDYTAQAIDGLLSGITSKTIEAKQNLLHIEEALITEKKDMENPRNEE